QAVTHLADSVGAFYRHQARKVAVARRVDDFEDAFDLDTQLLGRLPLSLGAFFYGTLGLHLLRDQLPSDHWSEIVLVLIVNGGDQEIGDLRSDVDVGPNRQVPGVAEDFTLIGRVLVEDVNTGADDVLRSDREMALDLAQETE